MVFAGELIHCGFCQHPVTGECKVKQTKRGPKDYTYYRCAKYNAAGHPRVRLGEADVESQLLGIFDGLRIPDDSTREWFAQVLKARTMETRRASQDQIMELQRQVSVVEAQKDRLLNLRLLDEVDEDTFAKKSLEFRDRLAQLRGQLEGLTKGQPQGGQEAVKAFELSQTLREKWVSADYKKKRQILQTTCLNFSLVDTTLYVTMRKPFDVLAKGLSVSLNRSDRI
jgi:hypothetical protein